MNTVKARIRELEAKVGTMEQILVIMKIRLGECEKKLRVFGGFKQNPAKPP